LVEDAEREMVVGLHGPDWIFGSAAVEAREHRTL
jgi:hypothetical protein